MPLFTGFFGLLFGFFLVLLIALRFPGLRKQIITAYVLRSFFSLIHYFGIWSVPGGRADAHSFLRRAEEWSALPWGEFLEAFNLGASYVLSWIGALLYKVFGVSPLLFTSLNVLLGSLIVAVTYWLAIRLFDRKVAYWAAWVGAIMPFAVFYSSVMLREVISILPFMLALVFVTYWVERGSALYALLAVLFFLVPAIFHGAWAIALIPFAMVVALETYYQLKKAAGTGKVNIKLISSSVMILIIISVSVTVALGSSLRLGSVGALENLASEEALSRTSREESLGGSGYPAFVSGIDPVSKPWGIPIRMAYFLFSPFPWDISSPRHLQGLLASFVFLAIAFSMWRGRNRYKGNRQAKAILIITLFMVFVFSFGTTNIGTSIRHRTKFLFALLSLSCGALIKKKIRLFR